LPQKRHLQTEIQRTRKDAAEQQQKYIMDQEDAINRAEDNEIKHISEGLDRFERMQSSAMTIIKQTQQEINVLEKEISQIKQYVHFAA
jgi:predicted RNase H-like nuclease (RuvC/YqgF family)